MTERTGTRSLRLASNVFRHAGRRFHAHPDRFLERLVKTWAVADQQLFDRREVFELFLEDIRQAFANPEGAEGLAQELRLYRTYGFPLDQLPACRRVMLWHGLTDNIVPPAMAWKMVQAIPDAEAHMLPGGHFMAIDAARLIVNRLVQQLRS